MTRKKAVSSVSAKLTSRTRAVGTAFMASVLAVGGLLVLGGCKDTGQGFSTRPKTSERAEYDCRIHSKDKICKVPWKDKVVLYCYKTKIPKVVRYREEC